MGIGAAAKDMEFSVLLSNGKRYVRLFAIFTRDSNEGDDVFKIVV